MKKNEYVSPEMEIVKIEGRYNVLVSVSGEPGGERNDTDDPLA